jgi:hypothetical protein
LSVTTRRKWSNSISRHGRGIPVIQFLCRCCHGRSNSSWICQYFQESAGFQRRRMGYYALESYDTNACAAHCAAATSCSAFNICKLPPILILAVTNYLLKCSSETLPLNQPMLTPIHRVRPSSSVFYGEVQLPRTMRTTTDSGTTISTLSLPALMAISIKRPAIWPATRELS